MALTFAFDAQNETPESIARRRELILALQPQFGNADTIGEGIGQALTGAAMGLGQWKANKAESAGRAAGAERWKGILGALGGGTAPSAPAASPAPAVSPGGNGAAIRQGLIQRGLPEHVADAFVMNFQDESGLNPGINEAAPIVPGSRGGFGLAQWTGPRRKALEAFAAERGVPVSDTDAQLDFLMTELQGPENAAFQKIMGAQDAGSAAAAIVNSFLRPAEVHRAKREARYLGAQQPVQTASLDPSIGLEAPAAPNPQQQIAQAMIAPNNPGTVGMRDASGNIVQAQGAFPPPPPAAPAQAQGIDLNTLIGAASDPWLPEAARPILNTLIEQQLKPKEFGFQSGRDGAIFRTDPRTGTIEQVYGGRPDTFRVLSPEEEVQMGLDPTGSYQMGADNKISKIGGEGTTVNIDQKTEGAFDKKLAEKDAETYSTMSTEGMNAKADLGIIGELETLLAGQGGTLTGLQGMLAQRGIDIGGATSDLQAAQALINKLVPTQRQPGSGSMSDRDVELFTRSLPSLWNQPGGNQRILGVMRGLAQYKAEQGRISDMVLTGEISRQEARQMLQALPNPLANVNTPKKTVIDGYTIEEIP